MHRDSKFLLTILHERTTHQQIQQQCPERQKEQEPQHLHRTTPQIPQLTLSSSFPPSDFDAFGGFGSFGSFTPSSPLSSTLRPLDFSTLPPDIVVIVKNLQKRDATTRFRAVGELQTRIAEGLDDQSLDSLLNIWVLSP
jgi:hypothetical protein